MEKPKKRKHLYPGVKDAEKNVSPINDDEPDWIGNAPNYDKFEGWTTEQVLVWLNID